MGNLIVGGIALESNEPDPTAQSAQNLRYVAQLLGHLPPELQSQVNQLVGEGIERSDSWSQDIRLGALISSNLDAFLAAARASLKPEAIEEAQALVARLPSMPKAQSLSAACELLAMEQLADLRQALVELAVLVESSAEGPQAFMREVLPYLAAQDPEPALPELKRLALLAESARRKYFEEYRYQQQDTFRQDLAQFEQVAALICAVPDAGLRHALADCLKLSVMEGHQRSGQLLIENVERLKAAALTALDLEYRRDQISYQVSELRDRSSGQASDPSPLAESVRNFLGTENLGKFRGQLFESRAALQGITSEALDQRVVGPLCEGRAADAVFAVSALYRDAHFFERYPLVTGPLRFTLPEGTEPQAIGSLDQLVQVVGDQVPTDWVRPSGGRCGSRAPSYSISAGTSGTASAVQMIPGEPVFD
jgi:hypothetical protein